MKPGKGEADSFSTYLETMKSWNAQQQPLRGVQPVPQATLLDLIAAAEPKPVTDLVSESNLSLLALGKELENLAAAGLITIEQTTDQGEVVHLTEAGRQLASG